MLKILITILGKMQKKTDKKGIVVIMPLEQSGRVFGINTKRKTMKIHYG